jgi:hypothetical protein
MLVKRSEFADGVAQMDRSSEVHGGSLSLYERRIAGLAQRFLQTRPFSITCFSHWSIGDITPALVPSGFVWASGSTDHLSSEVDGDNRLANWPTEK